MRPLDFPLLTDENIHPEVVRSLVRAGKDVTSVLAQGLVGRSDVDVLRYAHSQGRVVLTHDGDFGTLVLARGESFTGIIYLRPGHIRPSFVQDILNAITSTATDVEPPFLVVAERKGELVKVRIRPGRVGP